MRIAFFTFLLLFSFYSASYSQVRKLIRKAVRNTQNGYMEKSRLYYLKALEKDKDNYVVNVSLGITLSEFMDRPEEALPYLENAYRHSPKDTLPDLYFALGKCYQHAGRYQEAISFYDKLKGAKAVADDNKLFQLDLRKRKADCIYAMEHSQFTPPSDWYVVNLGSTINTKMPEYVPIITPNKEMIFTSKRQDDKKEQINYLDGKYFESMYISKIENGKFTTPRRYTVPDLYLKSKYRKRHESVVSMSPDGKNLFIYHDGKILEINMDSLNKEEPKKLAKTINFDYYQNHAYLSKDSKTLFFTSEGSGGLGGIDIYKTEKNADGSWGKPENLGAPVNTEYDEDAPFLSDDGQTLYFASRGHPGYGNFDIYKSAFTNGKWAQPENLGQPINSSAHDIFMVQDGEGHIGYFSSSRKGGKGDMDIYKINYLKNFDKECPVAGEKKVFISSSLTGENKYAFIGKFVGGENVLSYTWKIPGAETPVNAAFLEYEFKQPGDFPVQLKVISYCDTCLEPNVTCSTETITIKPKDVVVTNTTSVPTNSVAILKDLKKHHGKLTDDQSRVLGLEIKPLFFNYNKSDLNEEALKIIAKNLEILRSNPDLRIELYGFTDNTGDEHYNKDLSLKRAQQVRDHLVKNGLSAKQITKTIGKGEIKKCPSGNCTDAEHEANRRVEFAVFKK